MFSVIRSVSRCAFDTFHQNKVFSTRHYLDIEIKAFKEIERAAAKINKHKFDESTIKALIEYPSLTTDKHIAIFLKHASREQINRVFPPLAGQDVDIDALTTNPAGLPHKKRLTDRQVYHLGKLMRSSPEQRTLALLINAGIVNAPESKSEEYIKEYLWFASKIEESIHKAFDLDVSEDTHKIQLTEKIKTLMRNRFEREISIVKSDKFIINWVNYGLHFSYTDSQAPKEKIAKLISPLQLLLPFINATYSNMSYLKLEHINFEKVNISNSNINGATFTQCKFDSKCCEDVLISHTHFDNCTVDGKAVSDEECKCLLQPKGKETLIL